METVPVGLDRMLRPARLRMPTAHGPRLVRAASSSGRKPSPVGFLRAGGRNAGPNAASGRDCNVVVRSRVGRVQHWQPPGAVARPRHLWLQQLQRQTPQFVGPRHCAAVSLRRGSGPHPAHFAEVWDGVTVPFGFSMPPGNGLIAASGWGGRCGMCGSRSAAAAAGVPCSMHATGEGSRSSGILPKSHRNILP